MTLGFQLYFDKKKEKPTHFPERILASLSHDIHMKYYGLMSDHLPDYTEPWFNEKPKKHTIRLDEKNQWHEDNLIHFVIGNRTKQRYLFAPVMKCTGTQEIFFSVNELCQLEVSVADKYMYLSDRRELALNDGFVSLNDFEEYFTPIVHARHNQCMSAKIIHWTKLRYL